MWQEVEEPFQFFFFFCLPLKFGCYRGVSGRQSQNYVPSDRISVQFVVYLVSESVVIFKLVSVFLS